MRWNPPSGWFVNVSSGRVPGSRRCGWGSCPVLSLSAFARGAAPISPRALRSRRFSLQVTDPEDPLSMCMTRRRLSLSWAASPGLCPRGAEPARSSWRPRRLLLRGHGVTSVLAAFTAARGLLVPSREAATFALLEHLGWVALLPTGCDWLSSHGPTDRLFFSVAEFLTWVCGSF